MGLKLAHFSQIPISATSPLHDFITFRVIVQIQRRRHLAV